MKAQVTSDDVMQFFVRLDHGDEAEDIWQDDEDLVELTDAEVELVLEHRRIGREFSAMCRRKLQERDDHERA